MLRRFSGRWKGGWASDTQATNETAAATTSTNPLIPPVLTSAKSISQWCRWKGVSLCTLSGSRKHKLCAGSGPRRHLLSSAPRGHTRRRRNTPHEYLKTCHLLRLRTEFWKQVVAGGRRTSDALHPPVNISVARCVCKKNKSLWNKEVFSRSALAVVVGGVDAGVGWGRFIGHASILLQLFHWRAHTPLPTLFCSDFFGSSCRHVFSPSGGKSSAWFFLVTDRLRKRVNGVKAGPA